MKVMAVSLPCRAHSGWHAGIVRWARSMLREFPILPPTLSTARAASRAGCGGTEQCSAKPHLRSCERGGQEGEGVNESVGQSPLSDGEALTSVIAPPPLRGRGWGEGARIAHEFVESLRNPWPEPSIGSVGLCEGMAPSPPAPLTARAASRAGCGGAEQCSAKPRLRSREGEGSLSGPPNTFIHTREGRFVSRICDFHIKMTVFRHSNYR